MIHACCKADENLKKIEVRKDDQGQVIMNVYQCKACKRKHYEAFAEPGVIGIAGKGVGS